VRSGLRARRYRDPHRPIVKCGHDLEAALSDSIRVSPSELLTSGALVEGHAADVEAGHGMADARIQGAQVGLVGLSAVAVEAKLVQWHAATQALCARLTGHAQAFRASGIGFGDTETRNAESVAQIGVHGAQAATSALAD
jgi:uncharacterized protein YukE